MSSKQINTNLENVTLQGGSYGYSRTKLEDLGSSEYTIVNIAVDTSGSTVHFRDEMTEAIKHIIAACSHSPRADSLLIRLSLFSNGVQEFHGFKLLSECKPEDYTSCLHVEGGMTALFDASCDAVDAINDYSQSLYSSDFRANSILIVITDGEDNASTYTSNSVQTKLQDIVRTEKLESLVTILVGVNIQDLHISNCLRTFRTNSGFREYVELKDADSSTLAKLANFVSNSIAAQSQALGTGGASQPITF
jgi:uncharacterized protein YegL